MSEESTAFDPETYDDRQGFVVEYGRDVLQLLDPQPGERILDLGCGTGHLTAEIADAVGAEGEAIGIDASPAMVERAREANPGVTFAEADATTFLDADMSTFAAAPFDAVFSNAALHWIDDQDAALAGVADALRPGGRFVAEMGATGNVGSIVDAVQAEGGARGVEVPNPWHFPSLGAYTSRLERHGFAVRLARTFVRETELEGADGLRSWLEQFGDRVLAAFDAADREAVIDAVADRLRDEHYDADTECWTVDYRRLQFRAVRGEE